MKPLHLQFLIIYKEQNKEPRFLRYGRNDNYFHYESDKKRGRTLGAVMSNVVETS